MSKGSRRSKKNQKRLRGELTKLTKTPSGEVLSVLSVPSEGICDNSPAGTMSAEGGFVSFVSSPPERFAKFSGGGGKSVGGFCQFCQ